MIQKKKLVQFYLEQYEQAGKKRPKRSISTAEMQKRVQTLFRTLRSAKPGRVNVRLLEDYHRQLKNISVYAHRKNRADILKKLQAHGMTIFIISHDVEFVAEYADRVGLFFEGNVVTSQNTREFFAGNNFYTTAANRMARQLFPDAVTGKDVITCLRNSN